MILPFGNAYPEYRASTSALTERDLMLMEAKSMNMLSIPRTDEDLGILGCSILPWDAV